MHGESKAKKSRRDGGGEVGDGARAGVRLETVEDERERALRWSRG